MDLQSDDSSPCSEKIFRKALFREGVSARKKKGGLPSMMRLAKISPKDKSVMRDRLLKICIDKTKQSRSEYISRLRQGKISSLDLAREILQSTVTNDSTNPFAGAAGSAEDISDNMQVSMGGDLCEIDEALVEVDADEEDMDPEAYQEMMGLIYDDILNELSEEINVEFYDGADADEVDWEQLEDFDIPADELVLCPFCKRSGMHTDFVNFDCRCKCGSSFSFGHCSTEITSVPILRDIFAGVHER